MGNKIKYGLKNVHVAIQTYANDAYSYGTPVAVPGAVSLSLSAQGEMAPFYADDIVYYRSVSNNGYSGSLELALVNDWFRTNILGETMSADNVLVENSSNVEPVYFALLFEFDGDVKATRHVMYNCTASRPGVESATKEDTVSPGTESLDLACDPRLDGLVKTRTGDSTTSRVYDDWYTAVYEP